jgi:hypothetical protein
MAARRAAAAAAAPVAVASRTRSRVGHKRARSPPSEPVEPLDIATRPLGEVWMDDPEGFRALLKARELLEDNTTETVAAVAARELVAPAPQIDWTYLSENAESVWLKCARSFSDGESESARNQYITAFSILLRMLVACGLDARNVFLATIKINDDAACAIIRRESRSGHCRLRLAETGTCDQTALHYAVRGGHPSLEVITYLLRHVDHKTLNARDDADNTVLTAAWRWMSEARTDTVVRVLLEHAPADGTGLVLIGRMPFAQESAVDPYSTKPDDPGDEPVTLMDWISRCGVTNGQSGLYKATARVVHDAYTKQLEFHRSCVARTCKPWLVPVLVSLVVDYAYLD